MGPPEYAFLSFNLEALDLAGWRQWANEELVAVVLDDTLYLVGGRVIIKETLQKKLGNRSSTWEGEPSEFLFISIFSFTFLLYISISLYPE